MIVLRNIAKTFNAGRRNAFTALRKVDLDIDLRQTTVLVGPSGSGKTTLLSIIGCLSRPTEGRIWLNGREITGLPERFSAETRRQTFGFIFQSYHLLAGISVLENVMIPAFPTGIRHAAMRSRARELLHKVGISEKAHQRIENLSAGEQQRAAIARALMNDPPILIGDEPTSSLDTELTRSFLGILSELKNEGRAILLATHDPLVFNFPAVDRIVRLRDGEILESRDMA